MNKKGTLAEKSGYYFLAIIILTPFLVYAATFIRFDKYYSFNVENIEDSIIATRVLNCFSDENFLFDKEKLNVVELRKCFNNDKYFLEVKLDENGYAKNIVGELRNPREVKRYIKLKDGEKGIIEIKYTKKNAA